MVCASLDFVCDSPVVVGESPIPTDARLAFFNETRHSYGRSALLLSGGAALGFYHVGVVKALMENRLMPRVLGGSSAGSIVCAMVGTRCVYLFLVISNPTTVLVIDICNCVKCSVSNNLTTILYIYLPEPMKSVLMTYSISEERRHQVILEE